MLVKYKNQVSVNLDNVTFIKVDESEVEGKYAIRFHSVDGFEKHWECESQEEALKIEASLIEKFGGFIGL